MLDNQKLKQAIIESQRTGKGFFQRRPGPISIGMDELTQNRYQGAHCFWLITTGRSGTTTITRILDHLPYIDAAHEPFPELYYEGRFAIEGNSMPEEYAVRLLHATRGRFVENSFFQQNAYFDCSGLMGHLAGSLRQAFAWSRFVHLVREPRDFVCSALANNWYDYDSPQGFLWPRPPDKSWEPWQSIIWLWNEVHAKGLDLEREWGEFFVFRLRSEDLFSNPRGFEGLIEWMGANPEVQGQTRGGTWHSLVKRLNLSKKKPEWDPAWDDFLEETAGKTIEAIYGRK